MLAPQMNHLISLLIDNNRDYQALTEYFLDFQIIKDFKETQGTQFFNHLIQNIAYKVFMPQEYVIEAGKSVNLLYIFFSGMIIRNSSKKDKNYIEIAEKQILGEEFFLSRQQSKYNYIAHKESLICYIHQDDFYKFVKKRKLKKSIINNILSFSQFQDMSPNFIEQMIERSNTLNYLNHQIVFDIGDESQSWFIILQGDFQMYYKYDGQYKPLVMLSRGNYFGELEIIKKQKRSYRISCISTNSELLEITKVQFIFLLQKNLSFNSMINDHINNRVQKYNSMIIQNKYNLQFEFSLSPSKPRFAFNSPHVRIRSKNLIDSEDIRELYLQRKKELTKLLNYRIYLTENESSQSVIQKLNQRNPRLRQFLDRLNKGRLQSKGKQKEQTEFQLDFKKSHHKIKTEIALSSRDTLGAIKSTLNSPTASSRAQTNNNTQSPKIYNLLFKLQVNTKVAEIQNPDNLEIEF